MAGDGNGFLHQRGRRFDAGVEKGLQAAGKGGDEAFGAGGLHVFWGRLSGEFAGEEFGDIYAKIFPV